LNCRGIISKLAKSQPEAAKAVEARKREHIQSPLKQNVNFQKTNLFEDVVLFHNALPEINRDEVYTSTTFLNHKFSAPLFISGMTGGAIDAAIINRNIASACQKLGLGMGVGSMTAMLVEPSLTYTYQVRDLAPDIFLAGNIGANDLRHFSIKQLKEALKTIGANILAVHLNSAQELVQKEGQAQFKGVLEAIERYSQDIPIFVKEVGQGISGEVARRLSKTAIKAIDVAGAGGTNWIKIEYMRRGVENPPFQDWGIPTALALIQCKKETNLPLIATGGIRKGEEVVKALILGADLGATALPALLTGNKDDEEVVKKLTEMIKEIGDIMFLLGAKDIKELKKVRAVIKGELKELL